MRLFLSGGTGFIGKNLQTLLQTHEITAPPRTTLDLTDNIKVKTYFTNHQFDGILHAASTGVSRSSPVTSLQAFHTNLKSFANIQHHIPEVKKFIHFGSGAEYAKPLKHKQITEAAFDEVVPSDDYGLAKYLIAKNLQAYSPTQVVNLRFFGVFGPHEDYHTRFISNAIMYALCDRPIMINKDITFDYICIEDVARIVECFLTKNVNFTHYNVGTGTPIKLTELAEMIKTVTHSAYPIIVKDRTLGPEYSPNVDRLRNFLGSHFKFTSLEIAIAKLTKWYQAHFNDIKDSFLQGIA